MRLFLCLILLPLVAQAWGPFEARSVEPLAGFEQSWRVKTSKPDDVLEIDCQSFLHYFHHDFAGERVMSLLLDDWDCSEIQRDLANCFPQPGKACISDRQTPQVDCGACPEQGLLTPISGLPLKL